MGIGSTCLGAMFGRGDWNLARGFSPRPTPAGATGDAEGIGVAAMLAVGIGELAAVGCGVALGIVRADGVALGTINRPRRCDTVGEEAADGPTDGATVAARCGVVAA